MAQETQTDMTGKQEGLKLSQYGRFAIVIPVYNHPHSIASVVESAQQFDVPIFVIDDGSTETFDERLEQQKGVTVIRHTENRGKGAALRTGFQAASEVADWAVTIDADGQHNVDDLRSLVSMLNEGFRGIVVGVRQGKEMDNAHWTRRFGRGFSNFWVWAAGGPTLRDTQNGFRIYPLPETLKLLTRANRYQFEVEVLVLAHWCGLAIVEAPIGVTYHPKGGYASHFHPFHDFVRNSKTFATLFFKRIFLPKGVRRKTHQLTDGG